MASPAREQVKGYLEQLEEDMATLRQQLADAVVAQGVAEIRAATAELNVANAEAKALESMRGQHEELRAALASAQSAEASARAVNEATQWQMAQERIARADTERQRVAEASTAASLRSELDLAKRQTPTAPTTSANPKLLRSIVRERDGNGKARVVDHEIVDEALH